MRFKSTSPDALTEYGLSKLFPGTDKPTAAMCCCEIEDKGFPPGTLATTIGASLLTVIA